MSTSQHPYVWNLRNRLALLIEQQVDEKTRFKALEALTNIKATQWRDFFAGKQRPTAEMIEAASRLWPEYAFWLVTGVSDAEHGHIAPFGADFPRKMPRQEAASKLFIKRIETLDACKDAFNADPDFNDPIMQEHVFVNGYHRSAAQMGFTEAHTARLRELQKECRQLEEARVLEHEIKVRMPIESYEDTEREHPRRVKQLAKLKPVTYSDDAVEDLEQRLKAEQERLERYKRIEHRYKLAQHGTTED
ncbi:hypothetical protein EV679_2548 [Kerstersia gyiorum]|uniref:Uncharacterized protein n=1 Tax=Kerstersia gyiorum TaxID=206506 RepID=A0A4Q7MGP5_9BURK|nr:hypothetical protein [Kerstersia gyiorum]KAB0541536.1 hypothetical protein F7P85_16780 [Kerstersia gyiorum]RZS67334.1 hypothetical protein EV679_2548 [Kerstersia gyiorum]